MSIPTFEAAPAAGHAVLLDTEEVRLLTDLGFMAVSHGFVREAVDIFTGVVAARPEQEAGYLGIALARLHSGNVEAAEAVLRRLPPSDGARLFLAMAMNRLGQTGEAREMLGELAATSADTPFGQSARDLLDVMDGGRIS